jgi:putative AdoMet-dependent methyltransferase
MSDDGTIHDLQAEHYDENVVGNLGDYIRENYFQILDRVVDLADLKVGMRVLDIGVGTGLLTKKLPAGLDNHGIDVSTEMLRKAKEKRLRIVLTKGSFLQIPYSDRIFDRILSTFSFHHLSPEQKETAFIEMDRVLKDVGLLVIADFMFRDEKQKQAAIKRFIDEDRKDMLEEIDDEYFTDISSSECLLNDMGYQVSCERGSVLSWIMKAEKSG